MAGDKEGITAFQLDIKCEGLSVKTMERALEQARVGRLHILGEMEKALSESRSDLPATVPKMATFRIDESTIGELVAVYLALCAHAPTSAHNSLSFYNPQVKLLGREGRPSGQLLKTLGYRTWMLGKMD